MKLFKFPAYVLFLTAISVTFFTSCEEDFDEPPIRELPNIEANATIADVVALHTIGAIPTQITSDLIVEGIVIADDESGNFFRSIVIQDETAGIEIRLNSVGLYNNYPIGRRVWLRCRDLYIGDYNGKPQISGDADGNGIEEILIDNFLIGGERNVDREPTVVGMNELNDALLNTLIKLEGVQFIESERGIPYADAVNRLSVNLTLDNCKGGNLILRTSGFANFASELTPSGNGSIVGVYSIFGDDQQLFIRDLDDVDMDGPLCTIGALTLNIVRDAFEGGSDVAPPGTIEGIVISDKDALNITTRNLHLQDATGGIVVRFDEDHSFSLGDEIEVEVTGQELSEFNGLLQVNNVPLSNATMTGTGSITPRTATILEILDNFEDWESTLVTIKDATISGSTTFSGSTTVQDATGSIDMFTRSQAIFASESVPTDPVDLTAIISQFNDPQVLIRNLDDVGGGGSTGDFDIDESFDGTTDNEPVDLSEWVNFVEAGTLAWAGGEFSGNKFAEINPFNQDQDNVIAWLITPGIDLSSPKVLSFESAIAFYQHDGLSVWISTDFDGSDVVNATWTELSPTLAGSSDNNYDWVPSGDVDLSTFSGTGYIGFRYEGDSNSNTTLSRIDNVKVGDK